MIIGNARIVGWNGMSKKDEKTGFDIIKIELRSGRLLFKESDLAKGLRKDEWIDADGRLWFVNFRKLKAGLSCIRFK